MPSLPGTFAEDVINQPARAQFEAFLDEHRGELNRCLDGLTEEQSRQSRCDPGVNANRRLYALVIGRYLCRWRAEVVDCARLRARSPDGGCAAGVAMLLEVPLVVLLGPVERGRRGDLSDDLPPQRLLLGVT